MILLDQYRQKADNAPWERIATVSCVCGGKWVHEKVYEYTNLTSSASAGAESTFRSEVCMYNSGLCWNKSHTFMNGRAKEAQWACSCDVQRLV